MSDILYILKPLVKAIQKSDPILILAYNIEQFEVFKREILTKYKLTSVKMLKMIHLENNERGSNRLRGMREPIIINILEARDNIDPVLNHGMMYSKSYDYNGSELQQVLDILKDKKSLIQKFTMREEKQKKNEEFQKLLDNI